MDADVKQAVTWLQTLDTDFFYIKIKALVVQIAKCPWCLHEGLINE
jgi:hypothetical protein